MNNQNQMRETTEAAITAKDQNSRYYDKSDKVTSFLAKIGFGIAAIMMVGYLVTLFLP
jgi:cell division protein FtsX